MKNGSASNGPWPTSRPVPKTDDGATEAMAALEAAERAWDKSRNGAERIRS